MLNLTNTDRLSDAEPCFPQAPINPDLPRTCVTAVVDGRDSETRYTPQYTT